VKFGEVIGGWNSGEWGQVNAVEKKKAFTIRQRLWIAGWNYF